jgi:DNA repair exonuclease SbcCD ATPase subunit
MKPVPSSFLIVLLLALCGLCAWQWHRESELRLLLKAKLTEVQQLSIQRNELETRVKAADAEILRLTGALADLRANSVDKQLHEDVVAANAQMREAIEKQNMAIKDQNESLAKANAAIRLANENLKKVVAEREALAKRINEVTALYNALAKKGGG